MKQRVLGFDYGLARIGVAIGNGISGISTPLCTVRATKSGAPNWHKVDQLVNQWQPNVFVVGIALNANGSDGDMAQPTRSFVRALQERFHLPVHMCNERFTTKAAHSIAQDYQQLTDKPLLKKSKRGNNHYDAIAASLIVQQWLEAQNQ